MVDIEESALSAFEHDILALVEGVVEHVGSVGNEGSDLLGSADVILVHLLGIERLGTEEGMGDRVLLVAGIVDVRA